MTAESFFSIIRDVKTWLTFINELGCGGADCSAQSLEKMAQWGKLRQTRNRISRSEEIREKNTFDTFADIEAALAECQRCQLARSCKKSILGEGSQNARVMFVGGMPSFVGDRTGKLFKGESGELFTRIIKAVKFTRENVYVSYAVKCRPPQKRAPQPEELNACRVFLDRQIEIIRPEIICALGTTAAHTLLKTDLPVSELRGRFHDMNGMKLLITYPPHLLIKQSELKRDVWEDMKLLMKEIGHSV